MAQEILDARGQGSPLAPVPAAATTRGPGGEGVELFTTDSVHFNSVSSKPARRMAGRKSGTRGESHRGKAPSDARNVIVWLRQVTKEGLGRWSLM